MVSVILVRVIVVVIVISTANITIVDDDFGIVVGVDGWTIIPARQQQDWKQLASLVVDSFGKNSNNSHINKTTNDDKTKSRRSILTTTFMNWYDVVSTKKRTYQRYIRMARRMVGMKYIIFIAKDEEQQLGRGRVVGMIEMGIIVDHSKSNIITNNNTTEDDDDDDNEEEILLLRPTIGVLCVDPKYRKQGIATALVKRCENVITNVWNRNDDYNDDDDSGDYATVPTTSTKRRRRRRKTFTSLFAEVEPTNINAIAFFKSCGFKLVVHNDGDDNDNVNTPTTTNNDNKNNNNNNGAKTVMVNVSSLGAGLDGPYERRQHILMEKNIC